MTGAGEHPVRKREEGELSFSEVPKQVCGRTWGRASKRTKQMLFKKPKKSKGKGHIQRAFRKEQDVQKFLCKQEKLQTKLKDL